MRVPVNSLGKMYRTCKQTCTNANSAASGRRISPTTVSGYIDEMIRNYLLFRSNRLLSGCAERSHDNRRGRRRDIQTRLHNPKKDRKSRIVQTAAGSTL